MIFPRLVSAAGKPIQTWGVQMKAILWIVVLLLAAVGVASIIDYFDVYDVPMVDVSPQEAAATE